MIHCEKIVSRSRVTAPSSYGLLMSALILSLGPFARCEDSLAPFTLETVPRDVRQLWDPIDFGKDPLETSVVREWEEAGVTCRYVLFTVGTFKGKKSRCGAFYTFQTGMKKGPGFVWAHGGGQRADRQRGLWFARQGYATIDINWGGREMVPGIEPNTDWGAVDPSQGPRFYAAALRPHVKLNLLPDQHTIDPVVSPRNGNWFLLAYAGRRAITFLANQPEVDPGKIGFTGYSMGGNITSMVAIDPRLRAAVPMVGGSGFIMEDFPGLPGTGRARGFKNVDLYNRTIDAQSYWPHVKCPVLFLNASDDFHAVFDNVYRSANLLPHGNWRASHFMHYNHSLSPQQWILLSRWLDHYLKGDPWIPANTPGMLVKKTPQAARIQLTPDRPEQLEKIDFYYSHDPNARARFWIHLPAARDGDQWQAEFPRVPGLPLYAFANLTYRLEKPSESFQGNTQTYSITSNELVEIPERVNLSRLTAQAQPSSLFEDFSLRGTRDWASAPGGGLSTYKFRDPSRPTPTADQSLRIYLRVPRKKLNLRLQVGKRKFLAGNRGPAEDFFLNQNLKPDSKSSASDRSLLLRPGDFRSRDGKPMKDWSEISTFRISIFDANARLHLDLSDPANSKLVSRIEWVSQ
ncbi:MAG: dienelactone hydrolase family protein [Planctomycetota bacterium]|nr:dienelactone hydrolase family protein [Planctomycetota bacterium]